MNDTPEQGGWSDLLKLRMGKIAKSDEEYELIYSRRIERFTNIASHVSKLRARFEQSVYLTTLCHQLGEELKEEMSRIIARAPKDAAQTLDLSVAIYRKPIDASKASKIGGESLKVVEDTWEKALQFLRSALTSDAPEMQEMTVEEAVDSMYDGESEHTRDLIKMQVAMHWPIFKSYQNQLKILVPYILLAMLYRGLLYAGALEVEGGKLERKERIDALKELAADAAGAIPGVGLAMIVAKFMNKWFGDAGIPETVDNAEFLEKYLDDYDIVLREWLYATTTLLGTLRTTRESLLEA